MAQATEINWGLYTETERSFGPRVCNSNTGSNISLNHNSLNAETTTDTLFVMNIY